MSGKQAPRVRKNTDGGSVRLRLTEGKNPRYGNINKTKAPKGRQNVQLLCKQHIKTLSPRRGFFCCRTSTGGSSLRSGAGGRPPRLCSVVSSRLWASPISYYSLGTQMERDLKGRGRSFPRIAIATYTLHSSFFVLHSSLFVLHSSLFTLHSSS